MHFRQHLGVLVAAALAAPLFAAPSVFPTGTTVNEVGATWPGYTVLSVLRPGKVVVIDMDGLVVKEWEGFDDSAGGPARVLPNGDVIAAEGARPGHQESLALVQRAFDGTERWRLAHNEVVELADGRRVDSLRQHHDWQRADFPAGYYSPDATPAPLGARTLVLTHTSRELPALAPGLLEDDRIIEADAQGKVTWEWRAADHVDEFGFDAAAREAIRKAAARPPASPPVASSGPGAARPVPPRHFDWLHLNSATYLGPNRWFDAGDTRFAPDNVMISSRSASFIAIVARDGRVVWRLGPDFRQKPEWLALGQMIGQHQAHLIPKGLPGAGNVLVFDNGGASGYGAPSPIAPQGMNTLARATSRVLEIDPLTFRRVWDYAPPDGFFATNISGAQRLPNGNTLITEGPSGRVFEVTGAGKIVWEFVNPDRVQGRGPIYRAYRVPYEWLAQIPRAK
jgi:hypothetical protein